MSKEGKHNFISGNATHVGKVRKANEDYFANFETQNGHLFLVCDGMGGHVGGAKASRIAVESIQSFISEKHFENPLDALSQSIIYANKSIIRYTQTHPELKGMGSTCVAVLVRNDEVYYAHVGDSRIYLFSGSSLIQLTRDHSFVQSLVEMGEITEEEAEQHPRKNEITNALGMSGMKPPTLSEKALYPAKGDTFLLCSDGLSGMVKNEAIQSLLSTDIEVQEMADKLVELANMAGGTDNITVQLIKFQNTPEGAINKQEASSANNAGKSKKLLITTISLFVVLFVLGFIFKDSLFQHTKTKINSHSDSLSNSANIPTRELKITDIQWEINKLQNIIDTLDILNFYPYDENDGLSVAIRENNFLHIPDNKTSLVFNAKFVTAGYVESYDYFLMKELDTIARGIIKISIYESSAKTSASASAKSNDEQPNFHRSGTPANNDSLLIISGSKIKK